MIDDTLFDAVLARFPSVRELSPDFRELLRETAVPLRVPAGVVAFEEGTACRAFPLLTEGGIRVAKPAPNGREIVLYRVGPGDTCVLNLNCLLEESLLAARGTTEFDCTGISIPQPLFLRLVDEAPSFRTWVLKNLSGRILELMELISEVAFHRLDQRLARLLVSRAGNGQRVLRGTHQDLADELGSVREIVSRILGSFSDAGLVRLERGQIQVLDLEGLREITEGT